MKACCSRFLFVSLCLHVCFWLGCEKRTNCDSDVDSMISRLSVSLDADSVTLRSSVLEVCAMIDMTEDKERKRAQYRSLAKHLSDIDIASMSDNDRVLIFSEYWHSLAVVCAKMIEKGTLETEDFRIVLEGWTRFYEVCRQGKDNELLDVNKRKLRDMFENDARLFERDVLRLVFKNGNVSETRQVELYDMWHDRFGCRVKEHRKK